MSLVNTFCCTDPFTINGIDCTMNSMINKESSLDFYFKYIMRWNDSMKPFPLKSVVYIESHQYSQ